MLRYTKQAVDFHSVRSIKTTDVLVTLSQYVHNILDLYWHYYDTVVMIIVDITVWEILPDKKLYLCTDILLKHINSIAGLFVFIQ